MHLTFVSPRQVKIGDAAAFVGTTPRTIRHYHEIGLLPEPERGTDDRRRYGYDDMIRLMWIRRMAEAGIALDDIREAVAPEAANSAPSDAGSGSAPHRGMPGILERLEATIAAKEAELRRQRLAVQSMQARGSRLGLLSDLVARRLEHLPDGAVKQSDLDTLLVSERMLGPLGAALQATRFIALASHPDLRERSDSLEAAEEALDDTVAVDDPRVAEVAASRHAFEQELHAVIESSDLARADEEFFARWDAEHPVTDDETARDRSRGNGFESAAQAIAKMPYDWSPARLRCIELAEELAANEFAAQERAMDEQNRSR